MGSAFQVALNLDGGQNVFSVPVQLHYDQTKLSLINVDSGGYLGRDGQAVALVHRDQRQRRGGYLRVPVRRSIPDVGGAGTLCVLTFQATSPGDAFFQINVSASDRRTVHSNPRPLMSQGRRPLRSTSSRCNRMRRDLISAQSGAEQMTTTSRPHADRADCHGRDSGYPGFRRRCLWPASGREREKERELRYDLSGRCAMRSMI